MSPGNGTRDRLPRSAKDVTLALADGDQHVQLHETLHAALDRAINYIDTAPAYGGKECRFAFYWKPVVPRRKSRPSRGRAAR